MRLVTLRPMRIGAVLIVLGTVAEAQRAYTWPELRDKFLAANPTLAAGRIGVSEARAQ